MIYQTFPFLVALAAFLLNLSVKRRVLCASSIVLLYTVIYMGSSIVLYNFPRSGEPFSNCEAMVFLSVCYALLLMPALFYGDVAKDMCERVMSSVDLSRLGWYVKAVTCITVFAFVYLSIESIPQLLSFVTGTASRTEFRGEFDSAVGLSFGRLVGVMNSFSYVAIFFAVSLWCRGGTSRIQLLLLIVGGLSSAMGTLKMVSRGGIVAFLMYASSAVLVFAPFLDRDRLKQIRGRVLLGTAIVMIPFMAITARRFLGSDAESSESLFYTIASYFCTGPYSFNADYVAFEEFDMPRFNGMLTVPWLTCAKDFLMGSDLSKAGAENLESFGSAGQPEYVEISGAMSGEFKTIVGSFLCDFPAQGTVGVFVLLSVMFSVLFVRYRYCLAGMFCGTVYFYVLLMAPICYAFVQRHYSIIFATLIVTFFLLTNRRYKDVL